MSAAYPQGGILPIRRSQNNWLLYNRLIELRLYRSAMSSAIELRETYQASRLNWFKLQDPRCNFVFCFCPVGSTAIERPDHEGHCTADPAQ
jgi:hypothetical protein